MRKLLLALAAALLLALSGCGYNRFQTADEQIKASWSEVVNQYQRRADMAPNLVNTDKEPSRSSWSRSLTPAAPDHVQRRHLEQG